MKVAGLALVVVAVSSLAVLVAAPAAQQPAVSRKILLKQDSPIPGFEEDLALVEIQPGGREGRHTHPGSAIIYVQEGTLTLYYEGKPTASYKPGESTYIDADKVHEGSNTGTTTVKVLATFLVKKGLPMTTQVQ
ncbi:MAG: cupin domain-containing protein [Acidobacteriia bacterium]|nr:cupin domain-containing protein [Terriglobia bacterium]